MNHSLLADRFASDGPIRTNIMKECECLAAVWRLGCGFSINGLHGCKKKLFGMENGNGEHGRSTDI
ncbi:hypothetical protein A2U01_0077857, partial [Trifolium medium]|nr:hypothetical protein [Trifolium medium]